MKTESLLGRVGGVALVLGAVLLAAPVHAEGLAPLRIGMSGAFQPFSTTDAEGRLVGFDADVARALAERMGRRAELVQIEWAGIQAALQSGKIDLIVGSMAITEPRRERMAFSLPYYISGAQTFAREGASTLAGVRLAVTEDSTYARYVAAHPETFPAVEVIRYTSEAEIVAALNTDKVDAFVSDRIVGGFYIQRGGARGIVPFGSLLYDEACGIAARRGEHALIREVNRALFDLVQDGTYAEVYARWVGTGPDLDLLLGAWGPDMRFVPGGEEDAPAHHRPQFASSVRDTAWLLAKGAGLTLLLALLTAALALLTGTGVGVASVSPERFIARAADALVWLVRGTPLLVQLFIAYFALATVVNRMLGGEVVGPLGAALFALVVNTTAYNAETLRGGIASVGAGQWEAAYALGMTRRRTLWRIILPQAFRHALPGLGNNLVVLVKDTSLVGAITLVELTYAARNVVFQTGQAFFPFVFAAGFYLVIITGVSASTRAVERHWAGGRR